jgi:NAD-dependent deacetylase
MTEEYLLDIQKIKEILKKSNHAVFFGGAGVSTDCGIPDFRGNGGLYSTEGDGAEYFLSHECLVCEPEKFFEFFRENMTFDGFSPCDAHFALANLEKRGVIKAVITQNIDSMHQKAGSERVIELHGSAERFYCVGCGREYDSEILHGYGEIPRCHTCGSRVRPDVTLYGESLDGFNFADAEDEIANADVLIVGGTSLTVNPAASLVDYFQGEHLIIINYSETPYDGMAEFVIRDSVSEVLTYLAE